MISSKRIRLHSANVSGMDAHLRAGIAIFNEGNYHAAHDAWEDQWLDLEADTADERFLHGLIQFTAAVYHGYSGNWAGLQGLAESGSEYLADLPDGYRGVSVGEVREYLGRLSDDPEYIERMAPPALRFEQEPLTLAELDFDAIAVAALVLGEDLDRFEESVIDDAVRYARMAVRADQSNEFVSLVFDFVREPSRRDLIYDRLARHVRRRRQRDADVDGLFDP